MITAVIVSVGLADFSLDRISLEQSFYFPLNVSLRFYPNPFMKEKNMSKKQVKEIVFDDNADGSMDAFRSKRGKKQRKEVGVFAWLII